LVVSNFWSVWKYLGVFRCDAASSSQKNMQHCGENAACKWKCSDVGDMHSLRSYEAVSNISHHIFMIPDATTLGQALVPKKWFQGTSSSSKHQNMRIGRNHRLPSGSSSLRA
jgi:hypothetical protein